MAKFQKFNPVDQLHGLAEAARQIRIEELTVHNENLSFAKTPAD